MQKNEILYNFVLVNSKDMSSVTEGVPRVKLYEDIILLLEKSKNREVKKLRDQFSAMQEKKKKKVIQVSPRKESKEIEEQENLDDSESESELEEDQTITPKETQDIESQIKKILETQVSLKDKILDLNIGIYKKAQVMKRYYLLNNLDKTSTEYFKQKEWIECVLDIPWGINVEILDFSKKKSVSGYLQQIKQGLDKHVFGLSETKEQILNFCCKMMTNPDGTGKVLALQGSPGVGKTKVIRCLANILGLPFRQISLGGARDIHYFTGHGFTYEGAIPGRIVQILKETQCMNPIIYFDELDKISESEYAGINGFLTHLIDPSSNCEFQDNYLSGINIDISKVFFIFSFNEIKKVDHIVRDRMKVITVPDPTMTEKVEIAKRHLIPEILKDIGFGSKEIQFTEDILRYILQKSKIEEKGVRQFYRNIETICLRLNVLNSGEDIPKKLDLSYSVEDLKFPLKLKKKQIDSLFNEFIQESGMPTSMYL